MRSQVWSAGDELLTVEQTTTFGLDEADWGSARFALTRWDGPNRPEPGPLAAGGMAEIKAVAEPPAGLYRLRFTLPIALPGRPPQERDFWFAFSPWHIRRYRIDNTNLEHWAGVTAKAPVSQRDAAALALASPFDLFGPDAMPGAFSHWFGVVADTTIDLPAGRVRVSVDRRSIVSSWYVRSPETDEAATELTAGPHAIRVEYFQGFAGAPYGSKSSPSRRKKRRAGCPHAPKANWLY